MTTITIVVDEKQGKDFITEELVNNLLNAIKTTGSSILSAEVKTGDEVVDILDLFKEKSPGVSTEA